MVQQIITSPLGNIILSWSHDALTALHFTEEAVSTTSPKTPLHGVNLQLADYFAGRRKTFDLPLNPAGTPFQKKVWQELSTLGYGKTCNYQEIANRLGASNATRAVATAIAKNPLLLVIPCHRVLGKNGTLTGFSAGLWRKKYLLEHEQQAYQTQLF